MTFQASAPGSYGNLRLVSGEVLFSTPSVTLEPLAAGDVVIRAWAEVITGFNAATTNEIIVGNGVSTNKFLAAADITEATPGAYPAAYKAPYTAETVAGNLVAAYSQTGAAATAGRAIIYALISNAPA